LDNCHAHSLYKLFQLQLGFALLLHAIFFSKLL